MTDGLFDDFQMKIVCVKQPWAWLIVAGHKDIENRTWSTRHRGPLYIAASAHRPSAAKLHEAIDFAHRRGVTVPVDKLKYGGIIGQAHLVGCVKHHESPWFEGPIGWILNRQQELPYLAIKGRLGIFNMFRPA